jgi:transcriptional regulator with XRE-family HTH domain
MPKRPERPTGFAGQLRRLREAAGLTQAELGERAGFHSFTVAKLEQGVQEPTWPTVLALARALGVDCLAFVGDEGGTPAESRGPGRPRKQASPPEPPKRRRKAKEG